MDPLYLVRLAGIEPTTPWFVAKYSIQLSYSREKRDYSRGILEMEEIIDGCADLVWNVAIGNESDV